MFALLAARKTSAITGAKAGLLMCFPGLSTVAVGASIACPFTFYAMKFFAERFIGLFIDAKILAFKKRFNLTMTDIFIIVGVPLVSVE
ncbi:MAG: hypothetical protein ACRYG7_12980 [Janthinobacterium lividum]